MNEANREVGPAFLNHADDEEWDDGAWEDDSWDDGEQWDGSDWDLSGWRARRNEPSLALGWVAAIPLFFAYEWSLRSGQLNSRNVAELLIDLPLRPLGPWIDAARQGLMAVCCIAALIVVLRRGRARGLALGPALLRTVAEGVLAAICLGPTMLLLHTMIVDGGHSLELVERQPGVIPTLESAMFLFGGSAYEELVFRFGLTSLAYLLVRHAATFLGAPLLGARMTAEVGGIVVGALLFAALHFDRFANFLGSGAEHFDASVFALIFLAGVLLAILVRWRGLGVAAWAHGLYNLSVELGAGPEVFL